MAIAIRSNGAFTAALAVRETGPAGAPKPRLLDRVREAIGARHYSHRTEKAYIHWIRRYIFFHGKRHPVEMGAPEVTAFLTSLAVLHPRSQPRTGWGPEPRRPDVPVMTLVARTQIGSPRGALDILQRLAVYHG